MIITHKIQMDLIRRGIAPRLQAVQGDALTRQVQINLLADGRPWPIPGTPTVLIRYCRPDRVAGEYDTLADGMPAGSTDGTTVTITLAREVLAVPGDVVLVVTLVAGGRELSTFEFLVAVQPNHSQDIFQDANRASVTGMVPAPDSAQPGQILVIEDVDEYGHIRQVKAEEAPSGTTIVQIALDDAQPDDHATRYKILMSDGSVHTFTVSHGKSAYDYAQEAGYTKSEQDFAQKLADETPPALYITIDYDMSQQEMTENGIIMPIAASATFSEIQTAVQEGRSVYGVSLLGVLSFAGIDTANSQAIFQLITIQAPLGLIIANAIIGTDGTGSVTALIIPDRLPCPGTLSIGSKSYDGSESVEVTSEINSMIRGLIPTALKNPYALTFTGAASVSYDGSAARTVQIPVPPSTLPNPNKLILTGAVSAEYDGSEGITVQIPAGSGSETETILSDNLFDKSTATNGKVFYYSSSGLSQVDATDSYYQYVPLRGAGIYRTKWDNSQHGSTGARVGICREDNTWLQTITGTLTATDNNYAYDMEFTVTQDMINNGAVKIAFDCHKTILDTVMIVKDMDYPDEYIPYGYIEVATESAKKQNNVLCEKIAVFLGDSICAGTTVEGEYYNYGWAGLIGEANHMNWFNYGKNGGTITHRGTDSTCIAKIADTTIAEHPNADYVIFEGGCNDADQMLDTGLGVISSDYSTFDTTTFSGALESLILKLVTAYPNAKIGYIIPQKMYAQNDHTEAGHVHRRFFDRAIEICEKWGIPYVDLWKGNPLNPKLSTSSLFYTDGQHLTLAGYQRITPQIEAWMRTL